MHMLRILRSVILLLFGVAIGLPLLGQTATLSSFNETTNQAAFRLLTEEAVAPIIDTETYTLSAINPDSFIDQPIGLGINALESGLTQVAQASATAQYQPKDQLLQELWGGTLADKPELHAFEGVVFRVRMTVVPSQGKERKQVYKTMKWRLGKPEKRTLSTSEGRYTEYTWKGYKLSVKLIQRDMGKEREQIIEINDMLLTKAAEAAEKNRQLVKEAPLYSDIESLFR